MTSRNLFELFEDDKAIAAVKQIKVNLFMLIVQSVRDSNLTQSQVSQLVGITQPRVSNLMKGYLHKFSIDMLVSIALKLGAKTNEFVNNDATSYTVELSF